MKAKQEIFRGVATALATPFRNGKIDYKALRRMIEFQIDGGVSAIVICGTTGESPSLDDEETHELISKAAELIDGRVKMIVGTGSLSYTRAIRQTKFASTHGADGLLVITPFYNKGTKRGITEYFRRVADATDKPIIMYNVPSRTGVDLSLEAINKLRCEENIVGIKEASGSIDKVLDIATYFPELAVYSGNDTQNLPIYSLGGRGCVSVISNILPNTCAKLFGLCENQNYKEALELQRVITSLCHLLFKEVNPAPVKAALSICGLCENELRLPLTKVEPSLYLKIKAELEKIKKSC